MTFEEWADKMQEEGRAFMMETLYEQADRTMAREAWNAAVEACMEDFERNANDWWRNILLGSGELQNITDRLTK